MARILVVDEEVLIHGIVAAALEDGDHEIIGCTDQRQALSAADQAVDVILLHRGLPDGDCHDLVARVRRHSDPAIVLLSSQRNLETERNKLRLGAGEILYKPLDPVAIRAAVGRQLDRPEPEVGIPVSPRLLVVDDDALVRASVSDTLEDRGYEVVAVGSAVLALEELRQRPFEIVLTDVMMEVMSGLELVRSLPTVRPNALAVVMTGYASKDLAIAALREGAFDLLEKPLTPDLIVKAIDRAWRLKRYQLENHRLLVEVRKTNRDLLAAKEAAELASRVKSEFLANMSHEVRTPLNGVLGSLSLLGQTEVDADQRRFIHAARDASESLLGMLTDVLDYAAQESSLLRSQEVDVDLQQWVRGVVDGARAQIEAAGLRLDLSIEQPVPAAVRTDPQRLSRVLINLLDNARKFTPNGGISVHLSAEDTAVRIAVRDTGPGIAPELQDQIFQPFFQADSSTTRQAGGVGLGLALAKRLIKTLNGSLELSSTPGGGSELTILLPYTAKGPGNASGSSRPNVAADRLEILLADDDATNAFVLERMLCRLGHRVVQAENGQQAVDAYRQQPFDMVLLDYQMPVLDGPAAARVIRGLEAEHNMQRSRIVAITGFSLAEYEQHCRQAGMDDFLTKPIRFSELKQLTERFSDSFCPPRNSDAGP